MLASLITVCAAFFFDISGSSPIYNMQPAYITANIGTTGRNIRNLPCISRKSNQSGVCMFAIDCLKANGTHLGTCIDRFYFGSCCHIDEHNAILENTIDPAIIPAREPPLRISSTTEIITTTSKIVTKTPPPVVNYTTTETVRVRNSTEIPNVAASEESEFPYKLTTFQSVNSNTVKDAVAPTTEKPKPTSQKPLHPITSSTQTTTKPPTTSSKPPPSKLPLKPITAKPTVKPISKPKPSRPSSTVKPIRPNKPTANKPIKTTSKPAKVSTTRKPVRTTTKTTTVKPELTVTTETIFSTTTTKMTTKKKPELVYNTTTMVKRPNATEVPISVVSIGSSTTHIPVVVSNNLTVAFGNPDTNKVEFAAPNKEEATTRGPEITTIPGFVTWAIVQGQTNATTNATTQEQEVPSPTTSGWVLLPSVSSMIPLLVANSSTKLPTSSPKPTTIPTLETKPTPLTTTTTSVSSSNATPTTTPTTTTNTAAVVVTNTTTSSTESTYNIIITTLIQNTTAVPPITSSVSTSTSSSTTSSSTTSTTVTSSLTSPVSTSVNMSDYKQVCGTRMYPEARIVGGEKSSFGKWPWQISLRQWRTSTYLHKCGAALLNENWAITAAHCVDNVAPSDLLLRLGEHDLSTESEPYLHQERRVQIVASHPQFDPRTFEYDLALLRFYEPVTFQPNIIPVCVPEADENFVGKTAYVTGWGRLYEDGPLPSVLQEVSVPVINNTVCESMYRSAGYIEHIPHIFICAGWRKGGFDSCEGDSGGPMVIQRPDKRFLLAGVISWGIGCAEPNQPGVYTRISEFRDWINQILQF